MLGRWLKFLNNQNIKYQTIQPKLIVNLVARKWWQLDYQIPICYALDYNINKYFSGKDMWLAHCRIAFVFEPGDIASNVVFNHKALI